MTVEELPNQKGMSDGEQWSDQGNNASSHSKAM